MFSYFNHLLPNLLSKDFNMVTTGVEILYDLPNVDGKKF